MRTRFPLPRHPGRTRPLHAAVRAPRRPSGRPRQRARRQREAERPRRDGSSKKLAAAVLFALGVALFLLGDRLNATDGSDFGRFLIEGLRDGSIWLLLGGGMIASFGAAIWFDVRISRYVDPDD